jgi:hypothetical protein
VLIRFYQSHQPQDFGCPAMLTVNSCRAAKNFMARSKLAFISFISVICGKVFGCGAAALRFL